MAQQENIYKVQLPGTQIGDYRLADKYLALDNEDGYLMVVLSSQFMPGEMIDGGDLILVRDYSDDHVMGPWKLYSKCRVSTDELVEVLQECPGSTVECRKQVMKGLHTTIAIEATSNKTCYVMNLSHGHDHHVTYEEFQETYEKNMWHIDQVIR
jgi:hypothetical protein